MNNADITLIERIGRFMEYEARSCSMDFGCITPLYVYRMWGGSIPLSDIESAFLLLEDQMLCA